MPARLEARGDDHIDARVRHGDRFLWRRHHRPS